MSLRSTFTKLAGTLAAPPLRLLRPTLAGMVAIGGLIGAATGFGSGCDGSGSLMPCSSGAGMCVCDAYGCVPAEGMGGSGGSAATGGSIGTGGKGTGGNATGGNGTGGKGDCGKGTCPGGAGGAGGNGTGGSAPCNPADATCPCVDGACTGGLTCIDGLCINGCNFTYECGANMVCANGACVPACSSGSCATGYTCQNGACSPDPNNPQCGAANPCPAGQICAGGLCTTHCTTNSQCAAGQVCDGGSQTCIADPSPKTVCDAMKPCPTPETCEADGFCHYPCTSLSDCQHIDNRFVACVSGVCETQEEVNPQCTLQMPCPAGKSCISNKCF